MGGGPSVLAPCTNPSTTILRLPRLVPHTPAPWRCSDATARQLHTLHATARHWAHSRPSRGTLAVSDWHRPSAAACAPPSAPRARSRGCRRSEAQGH
eukprot:scaffold55069_cov69-Phaeocystis_antarctica.AAC.3